LLASSEERLRILMNSTGDGILAVDAGGRIDLANLGAARLFRESPDGLVGRRVHDLVVPEDRERLEDALQAAFAVRDTTKTPSPWKLRGCGSRNESFPMEVLCALEETRSPERMVLTLRDVSERELVEQKLFQAQRMEATGQLTAGIAHNFNNLLAVVIGSLEDLGRDLEDDTADSGMRSMVCSGLQAAERGAELTDYLLAFARRQPLAPGPVAIHALIGDMRELLDNTVPASIEIHHVPAPAELHARIDRAQLESALLNLVINATQAMSRGGRISLETERRELAPDAAFELELEPGPYVVIRITDTGEGIAPEHLSRVVEPFFTTRDVDVGTGLGLSMVHGFARQSSGQLRIDSTLGEGTTIALLLPESSGE
jgi:PAS domain S-box-containing protein